MIIIITGASHTGKTFLAQKMLEKFHFPYLSVDHLKMGLIRSGYTDLTPADDDRLTDYLWPVVREMIKTAIENEQNMIVEGCYIPFDWRQDFTEEYRSKIRFVCLAMTEGYIAEHFDDIRSHGSAIENRLESDTDLSEDWIREEHRNYIKGFQKAGEKVVLIEEDFEKTMDELLGT